MHQGPVEARELRQFLALLRGEGYVLRFRHPSWTEVLAELGPERWLARGSDRRAALADLLRQMLPSRAARSSIGQAAGAQPAGAALRSRRAAPHSPSPQRAPERAQVVVGSRVQPASSLGPSRMVLVPQPARPILSDEARAELEHELAQLESGREQLLADFLQLAPRRQRLALTALVARARAIQARTLAHPALGTRISIFVSQLGALAKVTWPGQCPALARDCSPLDATRDLSPGPAALEWSTIAERAEEELLRIEAEEEAWGFDEHGWCDDPMKEVAPPDPVRALAEVREDLERWSGPIVAAQEALAGRVRPEEAFARAVFAEHGEAIERTAPAHAKMLRWLRGRWLPGWGECMGRMRWLADRAPASSREVLERLLDPVQGPEPTWGRAFHEAQRQAELKRVKNQLLKQLNGVGEDAREELVAWLRNSFEAREALSAPKLAEVLQRHADIVLSLTESSFDNRRQRKRLRQLQARLRGESSEADSALDLEEQTEPEPEPLRPAPLVPEALLRRTSGKRVLFVCNRADPRHDQELTAAFGFAELDRCEHAPRRLEAAVERIRAQRYEIVLAATGFLPHKADGALHTACKQAGVLFVRVNKGRLAACVQHLTREFGDPLAVP